MTGTSNAFIPSRSIGQQMCLSAGQLVSKCACQVVKRVKACIEALLESV